MKINFKIAPVITSHANNCSFARWRGKRRMAYAGKKSKSTILMQTKRAFKSDNNIFDAILLGRREEK